ncbi:MAG: molybdenum cofactor synthesis protein [Bacillales bacterium]|jgi:molybdopterin molybdotransferase|nr:molybdenum cofactor synthesis protein [Bacillales bacterium]
MKFFNVHTVEEVFNLIDDKIKPIEYTEKVLISNALNRILSVDIYSNENVPNFRRSTVDGYAVKADDTFGSSESMPGFLNLIGEIKMGEEPSSEVNYGEAMYVPTGGMVPDGATSVVMIEHCEEIESLLNVYRQVAPNENIIQVGEDIKVNELVLSKGKKLRAQELGALSALGILEVEVYKKIKVGYISTGDEIVTPDTIKLEMGKVRDVNAITLNSICKQMDIDFIYGGIVKDSEDELYRVTSNLLAEVDCLILSGGSSVGTKDYSVDVINKLGKPGVFTHGISVKPGKPTILSIANDKPVIGLPGHPVSALIIFKVFGTTILNKYSGNRSSLFINKITAKLTKNIPSAAGRADYIRVSLEKTETGWDATPIFGKSGLISTLVSSEGIAEIPSAKEGVLAGELIEVILF